MCNRRKGRVSLTDAHEYAGDESSSIYLSSDEKDDVDAWKTEVLLAVEELKIKALSLNAELIME